MKDINKKADSSYRHIIGIDIGGTKCAVIKSNLSGEILDKISFSTTNVKETLSKIYKSIEKFLQGYSIFGISCGGRLNSKSGTILSPPNLPGWDKIEIVKNLMNRFGGMAYLMNDANACVLAEWYFGAARGYDNVIFLTHGTGMGAGFILNGKLYEGASGDAGEIGHIRIAEDGPIGYGKTGSFEGFTSGGGIAKLAQKYARKRNGNVVFNPGLIKNITAKDVAIAAKDGDPLAIEIFNESAYYLGMGLSMLIDIFNPEIIVLGSIYYHSKELIEKKMWEVLRNETLPHVLDKCKIVPIELGEDIGNYGAIAVAMDNLP
jgi:glucokinase